MTPYGLYVRKLRVASGLTLHDMSAYTGLKASDLSGAETGRKLVTDQLIIATMKFFMAHNVHFDDVEAKEKADLSNRIIMHDTMVPSRQ